MIWRFAGREMNFEKVRVMGILNITPDSFSDGGHFFSKEEAVRRALEMEEEGADLIDVGGESTRPGARPVSIEEEMERILPVLREIKSRVALPISVDTTKPEVAKAALEAGAEIINDVDGLGELSRMAGLAKEFEAGLILMHRRGNPETMQALAKYEDATEEVFQELDASYRKTLSQGVSEDQIVLDPGIGFSKNPGQNFEILHNLKRFQTWRRPVLIGPSRKSFIGTRLGKPPEERDWGTAAVCVLAVATGAQILRVHEVGAMKDAVRVAEAIVNESLPAARLPARQGRQGAKTNVRS
jgi:dihydropteroate synthase